MPWHSVSLVAPGHRYLRAVWQRLGGKSDGFECGFLLRTEVGRSKVVFIVGFTRSGSPLLEHLLSIARGTVAVGEMAYLWDSEVSRKLVNFGDF